MGRTGRSSGAPARRLVLAIALLAIGAALPGAARAFPLSVLTYNVAGLPQGISGSNPVVNTALISPRLNAFDLALVQEDFVYHHDLVSQADHPYQSPLDRSSRPPYQFGIGDGLNRFSRSPFADFTRVTWTDCFGELTDGSDCLTPKGFSYARHEIAPGAFLDVYNLHADANGDPGSLAARRSNLRQLADFIVQNSRDHAVLVLGDTNSRYTRAGDILPEFLATTGLSDVWLELTRGDDFPPVGSSLQACTNEPSQGGCEVVDKIFYRRGGRVTLTPVDYAVPLDWVDPQGEPLSDHLPVTARFSVRVVPEPGAALMLAVALAAGRLSRRTRRA